MPFQACTANKIKDNGHTNNKQGMTGRRRAYPRNKPTEMSSGEEEEEEKPHLPIFDGCPTHPFATGKWRWPTQQQNRLRTKWRVLETWWPCSTTLVYHAPASSCSLRCLVYLSLGRLLARQHEGHSAHSVQQSCRLLWQRRRPSPSPVWTQTKFQCFFFSRNFFKIYGNHPKEDLATSGYKPDVEYTSLINLVYSWLNTKTPNIEIWRFLLFFSLTSGHGNPPKLLHFRTLNLFFAFWRNFANKQKGWTQHYYRPTTPAFVNSWVWSSNSIHCKKNCVIFSCHK